MGKVRTLDPSRSMRRRRSGGNSGRPPSKPKRAASSRECPNIDPTYPSMGDAGCNPGSNPTGSLMCILLDPVIGLPTVIPGPLFIPTKATVDLRRCHSTKVSINRSDKGDKGALGLAGDPHTGVSRANRKANPVVSVRSQEGIEKISSAVNGFWRISPSAVTDKDVERLEPEEGNANRRPDKIWATNPITEAAAEARIDLAIASNDWSKPKDKPIGMDPVGNVTNTDNRGRDQIKEDGPSITPLRAGLATGRGPIKDTLIHC